MYWLNLDSVPIHVSAIAAVERIGLPAAQKFFAPLINSVRDNRATPWYAGAEFYGDGTYFDREQRLPNGTRPERANIRREFDNHIQSITPIQSFVPNISTGVVYRPKISLVGQSNPSTQNLVGAKTVNYYVGNFERKQATKAGDAGNQYEFKSAIAAPAITLGDPSFISRIKYHLADFHRPCHFLEVDGHTPIDPSSFRFFSQYNGSYMYINNNAEAPFPAQRIYSVSSDAVLNKTFPVTGFTSNVKGYKSSKTAAERTFCKDTVTLGGAVHPVSAVLNINSIQGFGAGFNSYSPYDEYKGPGIWVYYNDQHISNNLLTTYVALTGDYMAQDEFEFLANMELAVFKPWTGLQQGLSNTTQQFPYGCGKFPGGGEREYGRRMLFYTNPLCVLRKQSVASKFNELAKVLSDRVENYFAEKTNNYQSYEKSCLQLGTDGGSNPKNKIYETYASGNGNSSLGTNQTTLWLPWQMSYGIRGLYAYTKWNNDSKYRDLLLRLCRTMFLYGIFKEKTLLPTNRVGPAGVVWGVSANALYPNTWKTISYIRRNEDFTPLPASSYYTLDELVLPGFNNNVPFSSRYYWGTVDTPSFPGLGRGNWKGGTGLDVSAGLSGNTVISGISTGAAGTILTDFNREMQVADYHEWNLGAAQIAAAIIKDSDEAGSRAGPFSGIIRARQNAREYLDWFLHGNPELEESGNIRFSKVTNWLLRMYNPLTLMHFACDMPIPLTRDSQQYPINGQEQVNKLREASGTEFGIGGETGNYSMQPTPQNGGWTVFTSSVDSRIIYVSDVSGNDANNGLSPATPKKSIGAGYDLLRDGYPDWLLLARGETFNYTGSGVSGLGLTGWRTRWEKSGRSNSERMLFGAYGDESLPRPIIKMYNLNTIRTKAGNPLLWGTDESFTRNLNFVSLEFTSEYYPNFSGQGIQPDNTGHIGLDFTDGIRNFLMEDCSIHDTNDGMVIQSFNQGPNTITMLDRILDFRKDPAGSITPQYFSKNIKIYRSSFYNLQASGSNRSTESRDPRLQSIFTAGVFDLIIEECVFDELFYSERIPNILANIFSHHLYLAEFTMYPVVAKNIFSRASAQGVKMTNSGYCARNLFMRNLIAAHQGGCGNVTFAPSQVISPCSEILSAEECSGIELGENSTNGTCYLLTRNQKINFYANVSMDNRDLEYPSGVTPFAGETRVPGGLRQTYGWHYSIHGGDEAILYDNIAIGSNTSSAPSKARSGAALGLGGGTYDFFPNKCHLVNNIFHNISGVSANSTVISINNLGSVALVPGFNPINQSEILTIIGNIISFSSIPATSIKSIFMNKSWNNNLSSIQSGGNIFGTNRLDTAYMNNGPTSITNWWSRIRDSGSLIAQNAYPDPTRDLDKYQLTVESPTGGLSTYDFFMKKARENRKGAWDPRYTSAPVIDYIREGFGKPKFF